MVTHKEGIGAAIDAWFGSEVNEYIGASEKDSYRSDMEFAIRAYLDARGLVMVPKVATHFMLSTGRMNQHDWSLVLIAAPDPFKDDAP